MVLHLPPVNTATTHLPPVNTATTQWCCTCLQSILPLLTCLQSILPLLTCLQSILPLPNGVAPASSHTQWCCTCTLVNTATTQWCCTCHQSILALLHLPLVNIGTSHWYCEPVTSQYCDDVLHHICRTVSPSPLPHSPHKVRVSLCLEALKCCLISFSA